MQLLQKTFNVLFLTIIAILTIMSMVALIAVHWELADASKFRFSFSPKGITNYFNALGEYKNLFTATVAAIAGYFGLLRLKAATDQNADKLKQDRFSDWKTVLDNRFIEMEKNDPYMRREFTRLRYNLFKQLYDLNFNIQTKEDLQAIFKKHFEDKVTFFEQQNNKYIRMGGIYPNTRHSYSFDSFQFLLLGGTDEVYSTIINDLQEMYLSKMPSDRTVDLELYKAALNNYLSSQN